MSSKIFKEVNAMKKIFAITICLIIAIAACFGLVACGDTDDNEGGQSTPTRNDNAWFSQEELSARGLANLPAPQNLTGKINTDISSLNPAPMKKHSMQTQKYISTISKQTMTNVSASRP